MISSFLKMLQYDFLTRALIAGGILSACAAILGVCLVLRNRSMISDGLSHVSFGAVAIAVVLGLSPTPIAIVVAILCSLLILNSKRKNQNDAVIAAFSASALAIGTIAISINSGANIDLNSYLFGSLLSITQGDLICSTIIGAITLGIFAVCYEHFFAITFDEDFAKAIGVKTSHHNIIIAILSSITIVLGMKLLGALLISSLIVFPCLTAMQFAKSFRQTVAISLVVAILCFVFGLCASYTYQLPSGATIVVTNLIVFLFAKAYAFLR